MPYPATLLGLGLMATVVRAAVHPKSATLQDCLKTAGVPTLEPGSKDWDFISSPYNERLAYTPAAITVPLTTKHIQDSVLCGAQQGVKVTAKAGGHSYASLGLGGEDGHLVIQLDRMHKVTLDTATNIATVEPGTRLGHLAVEIYEQGNRAISHGSCPGVGVSGHVLHGGYGMSSHTHGLALDWVEEISVVLANSTLVECSRTQHPDLFWAMLGAGASFGIAASYKFNTFEAPKEVTVFSAPLPPWNWSTAVDGLEAMEAFAKGRMPAELNMRLGASQSSVDFNGMYYGDRKGLEAALEPLLSATGASLTFANTLDWIGATNYYAGSELNVTYPYDLHDTFYSKSLTLKGLSGPSARDFADYWYTTAMTTPADKTSWWFLLDVHGGPNSAVSTKYNTGATSYAHRDKLYLIQFYDAAVGGQYPDDAFELLDNWVSNTTESLAPSDWGMYINYADERMDRGTAQEVYWRNNLRRLQEIKARVDPHDLFYSPISIMPAKQAL